MLKKINDLTMEQINFALDNNKNISYEGMTVFGTPLNLIIHPKMKDNKLVLDIEELAHEYHVLCGTWDVNEKKYIELEVIEASANDDMSLNRLITTLTPESTNNLLLSLKQDSEKNLFDGENAKKLKIYPIVKPENFSKHGTLVARVLNNKIEFVGSGELALRAKYPLSEVLSAIESQ